MTGRERRAVIVRLANFITPSSGGLRTALEELGRGYLAAGHEPVLIVPGDIRSDERTEQGRVITLPGSVLPGSGGYRVLAGRRSLRRLLETLRPDRLEVSDRTTLRWTGEWARCARVPTVMVSHETAYGVLRTWGVPAGAAGRTADRLNARSAHAYTRIVCTTQWAEREFLRIGARNVVRAPLGVDLRRCRPHRRSTVLRARHVRGSPPRRRTRAPRAPGQAARPAPGPGERRRARTVRTLRRRSSAHGGPGLGLRPLLVERRPSPPGRTRSSDGRGRISQSAGRPRSGTRRHAGARSPAAAPEPRRHMALAGHRRHRLAGPRRSTDLLPQLLCLAGAEIQHRVCGTGGRLDRRAEEALRSALAAVQPAGAAAGEQAAPSGPLSVPRVSMEG
ncbi:glycosyltransferase [Streptomyces sp. NBC_00057]|uniref:glycosyltransferase n=1 Tax=Streptomyces sp. NBC_00057 TaxID=2975634 RepID=UPI003243801F